MKRFALLLLALSPLSCAAWESIPEADRATILAQTIKSGVAALAHQPLPEASCVLQAPALWPRAPFSPTYRPEARQGLVASGITPPNGPGMLRVGENGCVEMLALVSGDPGNAWVPYTGTASQLTQANYYARYGWGFWAGHSHGVDSEVCGPVLWYLELEGRRLGCGDQDVIDTWYNRSLFFSLWARYKALHPEPLPTTPTPTPPPVTPAPTPAPVLPPCPPEKLCAPPVVCEVCRECPSPPAPAVLVIPPDVLETVRKAPGTVTIPRGKNGPAARAWQKKLEEARAWAESANGKPVSP